MGTIKVYRCDLAFSDKLNLPETISDKLELYDLRFALGTQIEPYIELSSDEYDMVQSKLVIDEVKINVSDYYGNPSFYSVMPQGIFGALEAAALANEQYTNVRQADFGKMMMDYKSKIMK